MATYFPGSIQIGGELAESDLDALASLIAEAGVSAGIEYDDELLTATEALSYIRAQVCGLRHLELAATAALFGRFAELEKWCKQAGLIYVAHSDARGELDAEYRWWYPGLATDKGCYAANTGEVLMPVADLTTILDHNDDPAAAVMALRKYVERHTPCKVPPITLSPAEVKEPA